LEEKEIIKEVKRLYGVTLSKSIVAYWSRGMVKPRNSLKISLEDIKPSEELAYVIGSHIGDGNTALRRRTYHYTICLKCKDVDFALEYARCLRIVQLKPQIRMYKGFFYVDGFSKALYELLKKTIKSRKTKNIYRIQ